MGVKFGNMQFSEYEREQPNAVGLGVRLQMEKVELGNDVHNRSSPSSAQAREAMMHSSGSPFASGRSLLSLAR
jgi:hypothetical protein